MRKFSLRPFALAALAALASPVACSSSKPNDAPASLSDGLPASCSPLRTPGACMLPWPNAIDLTPDGATKTGVRLALRAETLPVAATTNAALDPAPWNAADGFSPATPILAYFPERLDPASLVSWRDESSSTSAESATILVDMTTGARVAHMSEVDANVYHDFDRQALILHPAARLAPNHRYAVGITKRLRTVDGGVPSAPPLFAAIADGHPPDDARAKAQAARMPDILAALRTAGASRGDLLLAWDFVTGSDEAITAHVLSMRDQALATSDALGYTITSVEENLDAAVLRRIRGTFTVPLFLTNGDEAKAEAELVLDANGVPKSGGTYEAPFTIVVPAKAQTDGPLPLVLFGHGLFDSGEDALGGAGGSYVQDFANGAGGQAYVVFATDWIGLSSHEDPVKNGSNGAGADAMSDFNKLGWLTDRLQQALVNAMVLVRTMRGKIALDPALTVTGKTGGAPAADTSKPVSYYGASLGGIMGTSFMGYDPDVTRGVVHVPGGFWSTMFMRSTNWREIKIVIGGPYPDLLDQQLLLALAQMRFDFSDPATVAPYVLKAPLPGVPAKLLDMQMAVGDAQVPNVATEMMARTMGIALLGPNTVDVYGLSPVTTPQPSALTTWDIHPTPMPADSNQTPTSDNAAHTQIARIPELNRQIAQFFATGMVASTCDGACDFPGFASDWDAGAL